MVSAWSLTLASVTVKSASSAARPCGDGRGERVRGEAREGHGEADPEDGPGRVAQPQPSRVRSHQHPLQHRLALPTKSWHEKGAAGSAAPSTGFMTASEPHPAQLMAIHLCHWHSPQAFRCAMGTPMDDAGPGRSHTPRPGVVSDAAGRQARPSAATDAASGPRRPNGPRRLPYRSRGKPAAHGPGRCRRTGPRRPARPSRQKPRNVTGNTLRFPSRPIH